jgi:hypothetical protein
LTYIQHVWQALLYGRPSHVNEDNWNVLKPTIEDFDVEEDLDQEIQRSIYEQSLVFIALSDLTVIATQVLQNF